MEILDALEANFAEINALVRQGHNTVGGRLATADPQNDAFHAITTENSELTSELSIILGFFTTKMRENLRRQNELLAAEIHRNQQLLVLLAAVFCTMIVLAGIFVRFGIVGRILKLRKAVADKGDAIVPEDIRVGGNDEITRLSETISGYIQRLQADASELIQARREAVAATEVKSAFLANMSHEIRTPLNGVVGMTHLALQRTTEEPVRAYLIQLDTAARQLMGIISDVLDFSKIEAGHLELERICFRFRDVLRSILDIHTIQARQKGLDLRFTVDSRIPEYFLGDPLRLGQILNNLISNAIKFTEQGSVSVTAEMRDTPSPAVCCEVRDTGVGIAEELMPMLFDPFWQADTSTTRNFGGTGLGLPICKELVEMMEGTIQAKSRPGRGSSLTFIIPLVECPPELIREQDLARQLTGHPAPDVSLLAGRRILVVDDSRMNRDVAREMLAGLGMFVHTANNGREAVDRVLAERFDLILMDVQMPVMDGLEATRRIRAEEDGGTVRRWGGEHRAGGFRVSGLIPPPSPPGRMPIIAMTAHAQMEDRERCLRAGMDDYLTKPFLPDALSGILLRWLPENQGESAKVQPGRILVVDDKTFNRELLRDLLEQAGHEVFLAANGAEALELVEKLALDLILLDLRMPVMDGWEAIRRIRELEREREDGLPPLPVIAVSADLDESGCSACREAGFTGVLGKPVKPKHLLATLAGWLGEHDRRAAVPPPVSKAAPGATGPV